MNVFGNKLKISIFGESHGASIGVIIDGLPSGFKPNMDKVSEQMKRRRPGKDKTSSNRNEYDEIKILSGLFNGVTCGTPLCAVIENTDVKSSNYDENIFRPSHCDYSAYEKFGKSRDFRGGGHLSGRLTAPLVFAGAIAGQILEEKGVYVASHIYNIGKVFDKPMDKVNVSRDELIRLSKSEIPLIDQTKKSDMEAVIEAARADRNSVGGSVEVMVCGIEAGYGSPFFDSVESQISKMMFSIPAVKGIEFGMGFGFCTADGKSVNDELYIKDDKIMTYTNNNAGINGGITNGMPIVFRLAIKPTPSIAQPQRTVNIKNRENTTVEISGRHDPCIVHRAAVAAENATALCLLDMLLSN